MAEVKPMDLSVIIVNFNAKFFLEQCLYAVIRASDNLAVEIFVVDNDSADDSVGYLRPLFPQVKFLVNATNIGFSKANNQALNISAGRFILFLNPDTIVAEDSFAQCIDFLSRTPMAGMAGVRMVDGKGKFLKESRRGMPTPFVAFCKMSGLTRIFPRSKLFAQYYLGYLPEHENNPADILSGAFMIVAKQIIDTTGGFDERFFMYAEDIDLSYRVKKAGFTNYYLASTTIIHFKGESTRKDAGYVVLFYKAMLQFMEKHFAGKINFVNTLFIRTAIRAASLLKRTTVSAQTVRHSDYNRYKTLIEGDSNSMQDIIKALKNTGRQIVNDQRDASEILFIQNPSLSFLDIISAISHPENSGKTFRIHSSGSNSIIGSDSKESPGESIVIKDIAPYLKK